MFGRSSNKETTTVSEYFEKKSKLIQKKNKILRSKINHAIHGEHRHYFSKHDVKKHGQNARCKVCAMLLSEFKVQRRFENWTPDDLKSARKTPQQSKQSDQKEEKIAGTS